MPGPLKPELSRAVLEELARIYGDELPSVLRAMARPGRRYYLRVNTLKASREEVIERLREKGLDARADGSLPEAIYLPVEGPFKLPEAEKAVVVDKFAAESAMMGSHIYVPGIRSFKGVRKGDEVLVLSDRGQPLSLIHISEPTRPD